MTKALLAIGWWMMAAGIWWHVIEREIAKRRLKKSNAEDVGKC